MVLRQVSIAEARAQLSSLINDVAHGKQRVVLTSHGRPKAALVSVEDAAVLGEATPVVAAQGRAGRRRPAAWLAEVDRFVERLRQDRNGVPMTPSIEDIYAIREGEDSLYAATQESSERKGTSPTAGKTGRSVAGTMRQ